MRKSGPVLLASAALLLASCSHNDSAATAGASATSPSSSSTPTSSTNAADASGGMRGTYSTAPLSTAVLVHAGLKRGEVVGKSTVYSLKLENGDYAQFETDDGQAPQEGDSGTYTLRGKTISFVSAADGARIDYTVHPSGHGFRLHVKRYYTPDKTDQRIATVIWTAAPYHQS